MVKSIKVGFSSNLEDRLVVTKKKSNGFYSATRKALLCARVLGLLPLSGLMKSSSGGLKFTLLSPYSIYYLASMCGQGFLFILSINWLVRNKISLSNVTNMLFYTSSFISALILAHLGRLWPKLMEKVVELENNLPPLTRNIPFLCNVTAVVVLILALIEHLLSILYAYTVAKSCNDIDVMKTYFIYDQPWLFNYTSYEIWKGLIVKISNVQSTFIWSYNDVLIMVISIYLAEHFETHNQQLKKALKRAHFSCEDFRMQYIKIVRLVKLINEPFGIYILTSFGSNLYWICTQLFYSLNKSYSGHNSPCALTTDVYESIHGVVHTVYFTYSFSYLLARSFCMLMLAARVHSSSIAPVPLLYEVPSSKFNLEIERYISQICNIKVALTGMEFFYVTRTMILTLLGRIVTYELVLLQFNKN